MSARCVFDLLLRRCDQRDERLRDAELYVSFRWEKWSVKLRKTVPHDSGESIPKLHVYFEPSHPVEVSLESEVWGKERFEVEPDSPDCERQLLDLLDRWLERCAHAT